VIARIYRGWKAITSGYELINPGIDGWSPSMYKPGDSNRESSPLRVACKGGGLPSGKLVRGKYRSDTGIRDNPVVRSLPRAWHVGDKCRSRLDWYGVRSGAGRSRSLPGKSSLLPADPCLVPGTWGINAALDSTGPVSGLTRTRAERVPIEPS